jgi:hypothetical protein
MLYWLTKKLRTSARIGRLWADLWVSNPGPHRYEAVAEATRLQRARHFMEYIWTVSSSPSSRTSSCVSHMIFTCSHVSLRSSNLCFHLSGGSFLLGIPTGICMDCFPFVLSKNFFFYNPNNNQWNEHVYSSLLRHNFQLYFAPSLFVASFTQIVILIMQRF